MNHHPAHQGAVSSPIGNFSRHWPKIFCNVQLFPKASALNNKTLGELVNKIWFLRFGFKWVRYGKSCVICFLNAVNNLRSGSMDPFSTFKKKRDSLFIPNPNKKPWQVVMNIPSPHSLSQFRRRCCCCFCFCYCCRLSRWWFHCSCATF